MRIWTVVAVAAVAIAASGSLAAATAAPPSDDASSLATLRREVRQDKRGVIERGLDLTPAEAKRFWPLYNRYQRDLDRIIDRQNRAVLDYIEADTSITDANARRIAAEMMKADSDEQRLRETQLRKFLSVLPAKKAVRYMQLENRIRMVVRYDITEQLPLVQ